MKVNLLSSDKLVPLPLWQKIKKMAENLALAFLPPRYTATYTSLLNTEPIVDNAVTLYTLYNTFGFNKEQCEQFIAAYTENIKALEDDAFLDPSKITYVKDLTTSLDIDPTSIHKGVE